MELLVVYAKIKNEVKLIGIHSDFYYLESRYDFSPRKKEKSMMSKQEYKQYVENSLYTDSYAFFTKVETTLDEESFMSMFSKKIIVALSSYGDEKVVVALSLK